MQWHLSGMGGGVDRTEVEVIAFVGNGRWSRSDRGGGCDTRRDMTENWIGCGGGSAVGHGCGSHCVSGGC